MRGIQTATVLVIAILAMTGCGRDGASARPGEPAATAYTPPMLNGRQLYTGPHRTPKGMKGLTIVGYNYTDTYIDSFRVNGAGGGNLEVSTPTAGGGKGTCCAPVRADMPLPAPVEITWTRDIRRGPWCKQTVLLEGPVREPANYFEVHFYQDGRIEVSISDFPSPPRVRVPRHNPDMRYAEGNVNNDEKLSECTHGRP
ncbi:DUF3304 domain-containing protein [Caldimonas manganoxidans]|uniref:DUF3304 domain-containing protein n=1 Tax=Caldimonas manganoxidans TaxID=196015 RepID=UPI0003662CC3|nr:DUF3304 domain-containing protein [Caldimonas manganoxidans]